MLNVRIFNRLKKAHEDRVIYTQEEADAKNIVYKPWLNACDIVTGKQIGRASCRERVSSPV